ncbi:hypothetical protein VNO77_21242 [Canavalia gladiata]|uniref:Uncharacterized protein n=1 Tax=Canavalia gladiata TaxID=3824 RepID=A0AAN9QN79_CANGL
MLRITLPGQLGTNRVIIFLPKKPSATSKTTQLTRALWLQTEARFLLSTVFPQSIVIINNNNNNLLIPSSTSLPLHFSPSS